MNGVGNMRLLFAVLAALVLLLFGCTGVPQEKYDALKASCDKENADAAAALAKEQAKSSDLQLKLSNCKAEGDAGKLVIQNQERQIADLKNDSGILAAARAAAEKISLYNALRGYYDDAFGPGKIANSYKLNRVEGQLNSISDAQLSALWQKVRYCQSSTECDNAKAGFTKAIDGRIAAAALGVVDIVGKQE